MQNSAFESAFAEINTAMFDVFGNLGTYTNAADGSKIADIRFDLRFQDGTQQHDEDQRTDDEVERLVGWLQRSDVADPKQGDTWTFAGETKVWTVTGTPVSRDNTLQWEVELHHARVIRSNPSTGTHPI